VNILKKKLRVSKLDVFIFLEFPRNLLGGIVPGSSRGDYMMLGLGDMVSLMSCNFPVEILDDDMIQIHGHPLAYYRISSLSGSTFNTSA
jgi:hypothetical protein